MNLYTCVLVSDQQRPRVKAVEPERWSRPKTEVVTQNAVERKEERGRDMELWSRHQFLKKIELTRSRL